jgi:hypothetical protein
MIITIGWGYYALLCKIRFSQHGPQKGIVPCWSKPSFRYGISYARMRLVDKKDRDLTWFTDLSRSHVLKLCQNIIDVSWKTRCKILQSHEFLMEIKLSCPEDLGNHNLFFVPSVCWRNHRFKIIQDPNQGPRKDIEHDLLPKV